MQKNLALSCYKPLYALQTPLFGSADNVNMRSVKEGARNALLGIAISSVFVPPRSKQYKELGYFITEGSEKLNQAKSKLRSAHKNFLLGSREIMEAENVVANLQHHLYKQAPFFKKFAYKDFYKSTFTLKSAGMVAGLIGVVWTASHLIDCAKQDGEAQGKFYAIGKNTLRASLGTAFGAGVALGTMLFTGRKVALPHMLIAGAFSGLAASYINYDNAEYFSSAK